MADFLSDSFDVLTGQQRVGKSTIIPTDQAVAGGYNILNSTVAPGLIAYNQQMAPAQASYQLAYENAINPYANQVRSGAYKSILDELNLGTQLPPELQDQVVRNALQGNAASGFGLSQGGRGLVARDLGLTGLNLQRQRQQDALGAANALGLTRASYTPQDAFAAQMATGISQDIRGVQAARDDIDNLAEDNRLQNLSSLYQSAGRILGAVVGGVATSGLGTQMGASIGGSIVPGSGVRGVGNQQTASTGGLDFGSILSGLFGNSGGQLMASNGGRPDSIRAGQRGIFG